MNLPPLPLIDGALFIDNSGWMEGFSSCYRFLQYKSLHLRIPTAEKPSLNFGSAQHLCREFRYSRYRNRPVDDQYYNDIATVLTDFYQQHPVATEDWRTLNWAVEMDRKYNQRYETEEFNLLVYDKPVKCPHCVGGKVEKSWLEATGETATAKQECLWCKGTGQREVMVELPFAVPLFTHEGKDFYSVPDGGLMHIPVIYTGRIDLPVSLDGKLFVMDHKTASTFHFGPAFGNKSFWDGMKMSSQQKGYCWAFTKLTGQPVAGYYVNGIRTSAVPQYVLDNGTSTRSGKEGKKKTAAEWWQETFQRERYPWGPADHKEWENNTIDLVEEFFWHYSKGYMPMKTNWCVAFGRCPYYDVCNLHPDDRGALLQSGQFVDNNWSPLNKQTQSKQ